MTQDCLNSPSTADASKCLLMGINVIGAKKLLDPKCRRNIPTQTDNEEKKSVYRPYIMELSLHSSHGSEKGGELA